MIMDFTNRIAVVTGATSGIGESTTLKLLEKGAVVLAVGRNEEKGRQLAARPNCRFYACDLADADAVEALCRSIAADYPKLDILINNAGMSLDGTVESLSLDDWHRIFALNVDSLFLLMDKGYVKQLDLIVSAYFWGNERMGLIPYIYRQLDMGGRFQLAVAGIHTKTCHFETLGGRKIVMHGSANLRSSGNIEQFTMEENPDLFDFYDSHLSRIVEKYATIRKPIRNSNAWELFNRMRFNH